MTISRSDTLSAPSREPVQAGVAVEAVLPSRARFRRELVEVLGYEGDGRFLVVRGGSVTTLHRRDLVFLPRRSS